MEQIPLFKVFISKDVIKLVDKVLASGYIGQGQKVEEFEQILRKHFDCKTLNTVNSATSGLQLVLHTLKYNEIGIQHIKDDDEILTTPLTCTATNSAIVANRIKIKWVDIDPNTLNIDYEDLERKLSPKTKAIMVVHWGGYPCDLDELAQIKNKCYELYGFVPSIIEDCAHAWGSKYKGKLIGTLNNNYCIFSFQAIKHLTTADGGLIISPSVEHHDRVKLLRWYGLDRTSSASFRCEQIIKESGFKYHMNDVNAAIGIGNYPYVDSLVAKHKDNGNYYNKALKNVKGIKLLENKEGYESSYWIYSILVENRKDFVRKMEEMEINVSQVHDRNDKHKCFRDFKSVLPSLDVISQKMICLPCGWWVKEEEREYIVDCIKKGW